MYIFCICEHFRTHVHGRNTTRLLLTFGALAENTQCPVHHGSTTAQKAASFIWNANPFISLWDTELFLGKLYAYFSLMCECWITELVPFQFRVAVRRFFKEGWKPVNSWPKFAMPQFAPELGGLPDGSDALFRLVVEGIFRPIGFLTYDTKFKLHILALSLEAGNRFQGLPVNRNKLYYICVYCHWITLPPSPKEVHQLINSSGRKIPRTKQGILVHPRSFIQNQYGKGSLLIHMPI